MNLKDSPFQKGLFMKVPKGTPMVSRWGHANSVEYTKRDVVVEISDTALPHSDHMLSDSEKDERARRKNECEARFQKAREALCVTVRYPGPAGQEPYERREIDPARQEEWLSLWESNRVEDRAIDQEYANLGSSRFNSDEVLVGWSKNEKWASAKHLEITEKPEARKKAPKINKRQQMVNKSRWKFTETRDIMGIVESPNYWPAIHAVNADPNFERPDWDHQNQKASQAAMAEWQSRREAEITRLCPEGQYIEAVIYQATAGEIIEVEGKFQKSWSGKNGDIFVAKLEDGNTKRFPYKSVEPYIEAETIPTVDIYVLRNKASGEFYKSSEYNETATKAAQEAAKLRGEELYGIWHEYAVYEPVTVEAFMKAKHFDGLGRAKTQILMMTGYYNNLPGADESLPEWAGGNGFQLNTAEWELVHFDKLARKEVGVVSDFAEWYKRAWELRELTVRYGSSVRTAYKALEKANLLDSQKGMIVFTETDEEKLDNAGYHGDKTAISDEEKALIDAAIASTQMKKGTYKKAVDIKSIAVTFPNKGAAMMFKLAYNGKLKTTILDLETLTEAVDG